MSGVSPTLDSKPTPRVDDNAHDLRHFRRSRRLHTARWTNFKLFCIPNREVVRARIMQSRAKRARQLSALEYMSQAKT